MRKIKWIFLVVGLGLFVVLLHEVGWQEILGQLRQVGWYFLLVLAVSGCRYLARTAAWCRAFPEKHDLPSFGRMFQVRLAGDSLTYLTVAGPLVGEPTKATLLRQRLPLAVGLGGTLIEAGVYWITSGLVILLGLVVGLLQVTLEAQARWAGWVTVALLAVSLAGVGWLLRRRVHVFAAALRWVDRGPLRRLTAQRRERLARVEEQLLDFYALHAADFRAMFLWSSLAQVFAMLEIYVILGALGLWVGWVDLLLFEALAKIIKTLFFFVPGRVGTDEGGYAVVFQALGLGLALGVGLALVRRLRSLLWSGAGLVILARYAVRRPV
ncbi:MAG: lysylphosphatidylglycerol synthase domain-containing protein [Terriglobia bacterium]